MLWLFEVGDKVKITNPEDCCNSYCPQMLKLRGKTATVTYVGNNSAVKLDIDHNEYIWCYKSLKVISRKTFEIGSRVKIVNRNSSTVFVVPEMEKYKNKTARIAEITRDSVKLDIDNSHWHWGIDMLELSDSVVLNNE